MADTPPKPIGLNPIYENQQIPVGGTRLRPVTSAAPVTSSVIQPKGPKNLIKIRPSTGKEAEMRKAMERPKIGFGRADLIPGRVLSIIKGAPKRLGTELGGFAEVTKNVIPGLAQLGAGLAVDVGEIVYEKVPFNAYRAPDPMDTTYGEFGMGIIHSAMLWKTIPEYVDTWEAGRPITPLIIRDAGNLSILGHGFGRVAKGVAITNAEKAAAAVAKSKIAGAVAEPGLVAEMASAARGETFARSAETQAAIDGAVASAARAQKFSRIASRAERYGKITGNVVHYADQLGVAPFKPYIYLGKGLGKTVVNGVYLGNNMGWGRRAADAYETQLNNLRASEPDIAINDQRIVDLLKRINNNRRIGLAVETRAAVRQAVRTSNHEKSSMERRVLDESENALFKDEINPATNEAWGPLSLPEQEAVIAVLNGRAALVKWLSETLGLTPEEVSKYGRYDATPEYYLSPEGARLAYDFINRESSGMSDQQYERLTKPTENIANAMRDITERAINGEGRRNALSPEYLTPLPFAQKLIAAIRRHGTPEVNQLVDLAEEAGIFDLPVDNIERQTFLMMLVDQLPDEIALDPTMYPANMRENIEYYRRVRRSYERDVTGGAMGEPIPPRDGGPRSPKNPWYPFDPEQVPPPEGPGQFKTTVGRGKAGASAQLKAKLNKKLAELSAKVIEITDKIQDADVKHAKLVERVKKYDLIDDYVSGMDVKRIAKKYRISIADVNKILDKSPVARAYNSVYMYSNQLDRLVEIIGVKRASLPPEAMDAELATLTDRYEQLKREADAAKAELEAARNINEIARQADESAVDKVVEEIDKLEDDLMDRETELENSGGDPQALRVETNLDDPAMGPITIELVRAQLSQIIDFVDNEVIPAMGEATPPGTIDLMGRISRLLKGSWDQAENGYFEASTPEQVATAIARLEQIGLYIVNMNERLNDLVADPPVDVPLQTAIADVLLKAVTEKQDMAIIAGTAPLQTSLPAAGAAPTAGRQGVFNALRKYIKTYDYGGRSFNLYSLFDRSRILNHARNSEGYKMLEAIIEDFADPQLLPNPNVYTYRGDTLRIATAINQLSRWLREVIDAKTDKAKIELILNPPDYVPKDLARKMLQGVSRDPVRLGKEFYDNPSHPLTKFSKKIVDYLTGAINDIAKINGHVEEFGTATHVEWKQLDGVVRTEPMTFGDEPGYSVTIYLPNVRAEGITPTIRFTSVVPKEAVLQAIDALKKAIEQDAGAQGLYVQDFVEGKDQHMGWRVSIEGLTKKLAKQKDIALKDLDTLRAKVEKMPEIDGESFVGVGRQDLLPGVVPDATRPSVDTRSPASDQPRLSQPEFGAYEDAQFHMLRTHDEAALYDTPPEVKALIKEKKALVARFRQLREDFEAYKSDQEINDGTTLDDETVLDYLVEDREYDRAAGWSPEGQEPGSLYDEIIANYEESLKLEPQLVELEQKIIDGTVNKAETPVIRAAERPGSYELGEWEGVARTIADNPEMLDEWRGLRDDAVMIERDIESYKNPTPEEIATYRQSLIDAAEQEIFDAIGLVEARFRRASGVRITNKTIRFNLTPKRGVGEWDWWWRLDGRFRKRIAREYFYSEKVRSGAAGGPREVRTTPVGIDDFADSINASIDEAAQLILETINLLENLKKQRRAAETASPESLADEYAKINTSQLEQYSAELELSAREYDDIVSRAEYLAGVESTAALPSEVRPVPDNINLVRVDRSLADSKVRDAAYEADLLTAMAKDASNKLRKAERAQERLKALEEYIRASARHQDAVRIMLEKQRTHQKARLAKIKNEERQVALRARRDKAKGEIRTAKGVLRKIETNPKFASIEQLRGNVPLRVAMEGTTPPPVAVELPDGTIQEIQGPMYIPTGKPAEFSGGISTEVTREGLDGFKKISSEHYRDGDRHTIFSVRLLAKRLGREVARMTENEAFRAIVAQFGNTAVQAIGETRARELWQRAYDKASSMPESELLSIADDVMQEAINLGESDSLIAGIDAYSMGVPNPKLAFDLAVRDLYGKLLVEEMAFKGMRVIDPYGQIGSYVRNSRITHESMFVPEYLREAITRIDRVFDPSAITAIERGAHQITGFFKTTTLVLSVAWQLGDLITNIMLAKMTGVDVKDMIKRIKEVKQAEYGPGVRRMIDPTAQPITPTETAKIAMESPVQDISLALEERRRLQGLKPIEPKPSLFERRTGRQYPEAVRGRGVVKVSFKINETINRLSRHAYFLERLDVELGKIGKSLEEVAATGEWRTNPQIKKLINEVADTANKWLGDYANLTMAERRYLTPFLPFYAWTKHIHQVFYALGREHPQSLRWYVYMGSINFDPNEDPMGLRYGGLNLFGGTVSTNFLNPFADVAGGPLYSFIGEQDIRPGFGQLGPAPRIGVALLSGKDVSRGLSDIARPPGSGFYTKTGQTKPTPLLFRPTEALGYVSQQIPLAQRILNVLPRGTIPGTQIATGSVVKYPTGEARLKPGSKKEIPKWGGQLAAVGRLFSLPGIPTQADQQIEEITAAAKKRLRTVDVLKKRRAKELNK